MAEATHSVAIIGAAGRMGRALMRGLLEGSLPGLELAGAIDLPTLPCQGEDLGTLAGCAPAGLALSSDLPALMEQAEIFIDFSIHTGTRERAGLMAGKGKTWIIGTTGLDAEALNAVRRAAESCRIVLAPNMSLGVNLLAALVEDAAARLKDKGYDIEVIETHHRRKKDAPSGTALFLGEAAARGSGWTLADCAKYGRSGIADGDRPEKEIGMHALRGGDIVGDHTVMFAAEGELLELSHRATHRDTFALGALRAAAWAVEQAPGFYSMRDVLGLI